MTNVYRIHPSLGIARLGDSPDDYFVGADAPDVLPTHRKPDAPPAPSDGKRRDTQQRIKRQGQRFRIYEYAPDATGKLVAVREVTANDADIEWQVHLANRKAAALKFNGDTRRNDGVPAERLVIDAGAQTIGGASQPLKRLQGAFMDLPVALGDILTDSAGRLIALGGFGNSASVPPGAPLDSYSNNDGWHDDIADGPVRATVRLKDSDEIIAAESAWLLVAPPDFAPEIQNIITLYDIVYDMVAKNDPSLAVTDATPISFTRDVYPTLSRASNMHWISEHATGHRPGRGGHFLSRLAELSSNAPEHAAARQGVFKRLRNPAGGGGNMPKLPNSVVDEAIIGATLTPSQYKRMELWAAGKFAADWPADGKLRAPVALDAMPIADRPHALDSAQLLSAVGAGRFPGIEAGAVMLDPNTYDAARPWCINDTLLPGTLTARMAVPWQADFRDCEFESGGFDWWPGQRPNQVIRNVGGEWKREPWRPQGPEWEVDENVDPIITVGRATMVSQWAGLGFVVKKQIDGTEQFVEDERALA